MKTPQENKDLLKRNRFRLRALLAAGWLCNLVVFFFNWELGVFLVIAWVPLIILEDL